MTARNPRRSEQELVLLLQSVFKSKDRAIAVGIGDDAAVLAGNPGREGQLVWTIDASIEGVHFRRDWLSFQEIGARALHAAVSDIAAMGATPIAALSALVIPAGVTDAQVTALARGQALAARQVACPVAGGNLARGFALEVTTTVLGRARRPLLRSGARAGDELWLIGEVGLARAGLLSLLRGDAPRGSGALSACRRAWRQPRARLDEGRRLVGAARACIDVSDGLARDAGHLAEQSGVRVVISANAVVKNFSPRFERACRALRLSALDVALEGGEDYALLATGPARKRPPFAHVIGRIERGKGAWLEDSGRPRRLRGGFDHLAGQR